MDCLGDTIMLAYVDGSLEGSVAEAVEHHLGGCPACCRSVAECANLMAEGESEALAASVPAPRQPHRLRPGERVGRYAIVAPLGRGGMSVVYRARDPELDRDIAIKLLRPEVSQRQGVEESKARVLREARALARLAHPNVVAIFDVGEWEDEIFVAMELVEGETLKSLLRRSPPALTTALDLFIGAGRGLVAAHAAELIHRDFKPDNVLVGIDGRPRVVDFGLARDVDLEETHDPTPIGPDAEHGSDRGSDRGRLLALTRTGAIAGTPAYMSPEQFTGHTLDARTDQFSFCVALYEAIYGERPFEADSVDGLVLEVLRSNVRPPPPNTNVPSSIRAPLVRGLAKDPADRFPTLAELLEELETARQALLAPPSMILAEIPASARLPPPARMTSRSVWLLAVSASMLAAFGALAWGLHASRPAPAVIAGPERAISASPPAVIAETQPEQTQPPTIELLPNPPTTPAAAPPPARSQRRKMVRNAGPAKSSGSPAPLGDKVENPF